MIDFTNSIKKNKAYAGANGSKIAVVYNGEQYMLKFPPFPTINKGISYTNSCISEYIGCKILSLSEYLFRNDTWDIYKQWKNKNRCCMQGFYKTRYYYLGFCFFEKQDYRF